MIIILNGPCGVGKTEVSWELLEHLDRGVMLDGDYIGAVRPFEMGDPTRVEYLYQTLRLLVNHHRKHGYRHFVINYVFEEPESLARLQNLLEDGAGPSHPFRLTCAEAEIERRLRERSQNDGFLAWELQRFRELIFIQEAAARRGNLGTVVDTTTLTIPEVAERILQIVQLTALNRIQD